MEYETKDLSERKVEERCRDDDVDADGKRKNDEESQTTHQPRVLCYLCHTSVYETKLEKHIKICPVTKKRKLQEKQSYYRHNVNTGGAGGLFAEETRGIQLQHDQPKWAQQVAYRVLHVHRSLFTSAASNSNVEDITLDEIHGAIPLEDLSTNELEAGIERALESHRIKVGGTEKHIPQLASLIGHLRQMRVLPPIQPKLLSSTDNSSSDHTDSQTEDVSSQRRNIVFLEMGAGRGMFGLTAAGVASASSSTSRSTRSGADKVNIPDDNNCGNDESPTTTLVMVERSGNRAKAEKHLRNDIPKDAKMSYMKIDNIKWSRVNCDLSHVHLPTVLNNLKDENEQPKQTRELSIVPYNDDVDSHANNTRDHSASEQEKQVSSTCCHCIIAKHLCGAGTDLALKSLHSVRREIDACIFATCCHGVCDWQHYVGRDYLRTAMIGEEKDDCNADKKIDGSGLSSFGKAEFDLMVRWCGASVAHTDDESITTTTAATRRRSNGNSEIYDCAECEAGTDQESSESLDDHPTGIGTSVSNVVKSLKLSCGIQGLGRACQRLIDYGRFEYLRRDVFGAAKDDEKTKEKAGCISDDFDVVIDLCHYTSPHVSPQNAILRAYRRKKKKKYTAQ